MILLFCIPFEYCLYSVYSKDANYYSERFHFLTDYVRFAARNDEHVTNRFTTNPLSSFYSFLPPPFRTQPFWILHFQTESDSDHLLLSCYTCLRVASTPKTAFTSTPQSILSTNRSMLVIHIILPQSNSQINPTFPFSPSHPPYNSIPIVQQHTPSIHSISTPSTAPYPLFLPLFHFNPTPPPLLPLTTPNTIVTL